MIHHTNLVINDIVHTICFINSYIEYRIMHTFSNENDCNDIYNLMEWIENHNEFCFDLLFNFFVYFYYKLLQIKGVFDCKVGT